MTQVQRELAKLEEAAESNSLRAEGAEAQRDGLQKEVDSLA